MVLIKNLKNPPSNLSLLDHQIEKFNCLSKVQTLKMVERWRHKNQLQA